MTKASKLGSASKLMQKSSAQKRPMQKKLAAKPARAKKAQGPTVLAEVVAQLAVSAEKLAQAADRLAEATTRLSTEELARHEELDTAGRPAADSATPQSESEAAAAAEAEQPSTEQVYMAGQGGVPTTDS
jgi:hypothetical protein